MATKKLLPAVPLGNYFCLLVERMAGINSKKILVETSSSAQSISNNFIIPQTSKKQRRCSNCFRSVNSKLPITNYAD